MPEIFYVRLHFNKPAQSLVFD